MASQKVRGIEISNVCGIEELAVEVGDAGLLICGDNDLGKTSILTALILALAGRGIGDDAIRLGADRAKVEVRLDHKTVRRIIGKGKKLSVLSEDGASYPEPSTLLRRMLGTDSITPLALLNEKEPSKVQAAVLNAFDAPVTVEDLRRWEVDSPHEYDCSGHGLEVIGRVRKAHYDRRTEANRKAKETGVEAARLEAEASRLRDLAPLPLPSPSEAVRELELATANLTSLQERAEQATKQAAKTEKARAKVNELRANAAMVIVGADRIPDERVDALSNAMSQANEAVQVARQVLEAAEAELTKCVTAYDAAVAHNDHHNKLLTRAKELNDQADQIEESLSQAAVEPVSDEDLARAREVAAECAAANKAAQEAVAAHQRVVDADKSAANARKAADQAKAEADRLDRIVKTLSEVAPAEIAARSEGIPGLSIEGDDVLLDGVSFQRLNGAKRARMAVRIAKRAIAKANPEARVLICDGLECLGKRQLEAFVSESTADGWQLFGTRVTEDDRLVLIPLTTVPANTTSATEAAE